MTAPDLRGELLSYRGRCATEAMLRSLRDLRRRGEATVGAGTDPGHQLPPVLAKVHSVAASLANEIQNVAKLLEGGLSLSEIISPKTSPKKACQLALSGS